MSERPILFSGPMVRAILEGRKTVTRRVIRGSLPTDPAPVHFACPYGRKGDRLWVRETFYCDDYRYPDAPVEDLRRLLEYRADHRCANWEAGCPCRDENGRSNWRPSIHMPRWACRLELEVVSVRAERLHEITDGAEVLAEGVLTSSRDGFANLWDEINGKRAPWRDNPWVWRVEFRRVG